MTAHFLLIKDHTVTHSIRVSADTACIDEVVLRQVVLYPCIFCDIAICHVYHDAKRLVGLLYPVEKGPPHDTHKCSIVKFHAAPDVFRQAYGTVMITLVTCFAECDQVIRCVSPGLTAFDMMHVKHWIFRFAFATLALMAVTEEYILTYVPEVELFALLIAGTGYVRVLDFLDIE